MMILYNQICQLQSRTTKDDIFFIIKASLTSEVFDPYRSLQAELPCPSNMSYPLTFSLFSLIIVFFWLYMLYTLCL